MDEKIEGNETQTNSENTILNNIGLTWKIECDEFMLNLSSLMEKLRDNNNNIKSCLLFICPIRLFDPFGFECFEFQETWEEWGVQFNSSTVQTIVSRVAEIQSNWPCRNKGSPADMGTEVRVTATWTSWDVTHLRMSLTGCYSQDVTNHCMGCSG